MVRSDDPEPTEDDEEPLRFAEAIGLKKGQAELDFVNVPVDTDVPLFVDPFAISQRPDEFSKSCHGTLVSFFQLVVESIRAGDAPAPPQSTGLTSRGCVRAARRGMNARQP